MKSYAENRTHYKMLISKINEEVNFGNYLLQLGYELIKKSAGSKEFKKESDRIVLNTKRKPNSYFNRNNSEDKGRFFGFLSYRNTNFYEVIKIGLETINSSHLFVDRTKNYNRIKTREPLATKFSIEPLTRTEYLEKFRGISLKTLQSEAFKDRCFNAHYINANGSKIANIALPKYNIAGQIKNYTVYNKPYWSKTSNSIKKYRRVINSNYEYLFTSNPNSPVNGIACFESGFDAMAFHEINSQPNLFYLSFSGQLDEKKLEQFFQWRNKIDPEQKLPITLAFDLDQAGLYFDLYLIKALIERERSTPIPELARKDSELRFSFNYPSSNSELIEIHHKLFQDTLSKFDSSIGIQPLSIVRFQNQLALIFKMDALLALPNMLDHWNTIIRAITDQFLNSRILIRKSELHKDWNQALIWSKNYSPIRDEELIENKVLQNVWAVVPKLPNFKMKQSFFKVIQMHKNHILIDTGEPHYLKISRDIVIEYYRERRIEQNLKNTRDRAHARKK